MKKSISDLGNSGKNYSHQLLFFHVNKKKIFFASSQFERYLSGPA